MGGRAAYSGKWSDEDDVADQHHDLSTWQVRAAHLASPSSL